MDGASFPARLPEPDGGVLKLYVFAHKGMLTVWAGECFFFEKPVEFERAVNVTAFAEGGQAVLKKLDVREIKPDPDNRNKSYYCGCGHGGIRRNPE